MEKIQNMAERLKRLADEKELIQRMDRDRELPTGSLSPRGRVDALVEQGSFFEIGGLARSQQPSAEAETPADGMITGYGRIAGRESVLVVEDPVVLGKTDGQVAKNKRGRIIGHAIYRGMPLIYLVDGPPEYRTFDPEHGALFGHYGERRPEPNVSQLKYPFVSVIHGFCSGRDATLALSADVVIATPTASFSAASVPDAKSMASLADLTAANDEGALRLVRQFLELMPASPIEPLKPLDGRSGAKAANPFNDKCLPRSISAGDVANGLIDDGPFLTLSMSEQLVTGIATIDGLPVVLAVSSGGTLIGSSELDRIGRAARLSDRSRIPLVMVQDTAGYDPDQVASSAFLNSVKDACQTIASSSSPKLCLVTGRGHVLGDFVLGGRQLGIHYCVAWPTADIGIVDVASYQPRDGDPQQEGPWEAAGSGLIDDVITPGETRDRLAAMIAVLGRSRAIPEADHDGRYVSLI